jgi:hypothetical protein
MAKNKSIIKIIGTLDDLTFYKGKDGYIVRTKGGVSKSRIMNDPAFARTRENGTEFGHIAHMGKLLRRSTIGLIEDAKDVRLSSRLVEVMARVKNEDLVSNRGERNVATGLTTVAGKQHLRGFDFNINAPLESVLLTDYSLNTGTGVIELVDFSPMQHVAVPQGTTHLSLRCGFLNLDFDSGTKDLEVSPIINMGVDSAAATVTLTPAGVPTGTGNELFFLKVAFFQEVNGTQYPLHNGAFNALQLVEVL